MMLKKSLLFFLFPLTAFCQENNFITGHLFNKANKAIAGVHVLALKNDSSVITGTFTDKYGFYKLSKTPSIVFIKAQIQDYTAEVKKYSNEKTVDFTLLETIKNTLKEVSVTAQKQIVEYKADKTIFNLENSIGSAGGDAVDAIKRAPGVMVSRNEISIAGKSSVALMINGRLQQLSGEDLTQMLHTIPADNISKIEIINSPSAKYDAEGNAGIINLILKKNRQQGFNGNVTATYEYNTPINFPTASTTLNYKKNNLNLSFNANGGVQGWNYDAYTNSFYPQTFWHQDVKYPYVQSFARMQLSGDYLLSKKSTVGFMVNNASSWLNNDEQIIASSYDLNNHLDSTIITRGKTTDKFLGKFTTNLNYEYRFDSTGKKMNIDFDYYRQKGDKYRPFSVENDSLTSPFYYKTNNRMTGSPLTEITSLKADFEIPIKVAKLNFGMKASNSKNDLNNLYETQVGNNYVSDTSKSNQFIYAEAIQAAYFTLTKSWNKIEVSAGLRAEHTSGEGNSLTTAKTTTTDYTKLFPSATVQYSYSNLHSFSLSFARRINRPGYNFLNPFKFYYTPNTYVEGNPYLEPSYNYLTKLGYTYKSNINATLLYNYITNYFDRVYTVDTLHETNVVSRKNLGNKNVLALEINGSFQPKKWWEITGNINGGIVKFASSEAVGKSDFTGFNWWVEMNNNFYLNKKKTWMAEVSGYYYSPRQRDVVYWAEMSCVNLGLRYSMLQKNLVVSLYAEDIFAQSYWLQTNKLNNTVEYSYDGHPYRISFSYKFGNKNIRAKQVKNVEEIQRANQL